MSCVNMDTTKWCSVLNCCNSAALNKPSSTQSVNTVCYFNFPRNLSSQSKWIEFCANPMLEGCSSQNINNHKYVCSRHFKMEDFQTKSCKKLLRQSCPSINPSSTSPSHTSPPSSPPNDSDSIPTTQSFTSNNSIFRTEPDIILPFDNFYEQSKKDNSFEVKGSLESLHNSNVKGCDSRVVNRSSKRNFTSKSKFLTLAAIKMTRKCQLTASPRKQYLYEYAKSKERILKTLKKKHFNLKKQLSVRQISELNPNEFCNKIRLSHQISRASATFLASQLRCSSKKPKGRRWTMEEKLLALAMYKKSPKAYRFMRCMFTLPTKKTLNSLLSGVNFAAGINQEIFTTLASTVGKLEDCDKMCVLLFDEMAIREHLSYNPSTDRIVGVEDYGDRGRTDKVATQAMVFMVVGLLKRWKQPIAYYFSSSGITAEILVDLMKSVLLECKQAGLRVMATVCDMGTNQRKALRLLGSTKSNPQFNFDGQTIITIFDPPHLIKCIRNQLILHDCHLTFMTLNGEEMKGTARWKDILDTYEKDKLSKHFRWLWKLSDRHMDPKGRAKLKVKLASQVLSHSVAASINKDVACGWTEPSAAATSHFVEFMDQTFDSLNGGRTADPKTLRNRLTADSPHWEFWEKAEKIIEGLEFDSSRKNQRIQRPPSQDGLIMTIEGMRRLWGAVSEVNNGNTKVSYLVPRNVNQDPLENTFGAIRANCGSNCTPNVGQFVGAFKTSIINGFAHQEASQGSNCEDDGGSLLSNLQSLLTCASLGNSESNLDNIVLEEEIAEQSIGVSEDSLPLDAPKDLSAVSYVGGYIAKRILTNNPCNICKNCLLNCDPVGSCEPGLLFKEYEDGRQRLTYASEELVRAVDSCSVLLEKGLEKQIHQENILRTFSDIMKQKVDFNWVCSIHMVEIVDKIVNSVCSIGLPWWCKRQNRKFVELARAKRMKK